MLTWRVQNDRGGASVTPSRKGGHCEGGQMLLKLVRKEGGQLLWKGCPPEKEYPVSSRSLLAGEAVLWSTIRPLLCQPNPAHPHWGCFPAPVFSMAGPDAGHANTSFIIFIVL